MRWHFLILALAAQQYTGPRPPKADVPYLRHASNLVEAEIGEAKEENRKDDVVYVIAGAGSPVKTPLTTPIFLFLGDKMDPERLQLYKLETKGGRREVLFSKKKRQVAKPIRMTVTRLSQDGVFRLEVDESLANGEYSLTPDGSNRVFCFAVY
jgi:hypothetical protein